MGDKRLFELFFSDIVAVSSVGGENRSTRENNDMQHMTD
jgi:hypothetical protein